MKWTRQRGERVVTPLSSSNDRTGEDLARGGDRELGGWRSARLSERARVAELAPVALMSGFERLMEEVDAYLEFWRLSDEMPEVRARGSR